MTDRLRKAAVPARTGYTVIELIVVITVMGSILFMTLPKFSSLLFSDDIESTKKWISIKSSLLKEKAITDRMDYAMIFDRTEGIIQIEVNTEQELETEEEDSLLTEEDSEEGEGQDNNKFTIPNGVYLTSLLFKNGDTEEDKEKVVFYKKGYSDWAIINLEGDNGDQKISIEIEPFIMTPVIFGDHKQF